MQAIDTRYYVQANSFGDPSIFIGGPSGVGTVYHGQWAFVPVPEPASIGLIIVGAGLLLVWKTRRAPKVTGANAGGPGGLAMQGGPCRLSRHLIRPQCDSNFGNNFR